MQARGNAVTRIPDAGRKYRPLGYSLACWRVCTVRGTTLGRWPGQVQCAEQERALRAGMRRMPCATAWWSAMPGVSMQSRTLHASSSSIRARRSRPSPNPTRLRLRVPDGQPLEREVGDEPRYEAAGDVMVASWGEPAASGDRSRAAMPRTGGRSSCGSILVGALPEDDLGPSDAQVAHVDSLAARGNQRCNQGGSEQRQSGETVLLEFWAEERPLPRGRRRGCTA